MAKDPNAVNQLDIEGNATDRAIRAVRDYQKGAATTGFLVSQLALQGVNFQLVSLATRVPVAMLQKLRDQA